MKSKVILLIIMTLCTLFTSCHGDLNIIQKSEISTNSMWQSESDAISAMYGMYNKFRIAFSDGLMYWGEYRTGLWGDGLMTQTSRDQVYQSHIPTNHKYANWDKIYTTINTANLILKYTPNISFNNDIDKKRVMANAYFVRAFCYYWVGRIWGDAPVLLDGFESDKQDGLYPTRNLADEVFAQVGSDIKDALSLMPISVSERNLASLASINMLKADYSLWMYKVRGAGDTALTDAETAIAALLNNANYSLEENYADIFTHELGKEIIFAWSYIQDEYTGGYPADYLVPNQYVSNEFIENPVKTGSHQQWCFYTDDYKNILSEYEMDSRTIVSYETFYDKYKNDTLQWINKFAGTWQNGTRIFDSDIIVYRYADALLFDAEIKMLQNNISGAVMSLNKVAERAYGKKDFYSTDISSEVLKNIILNERMKEFAAEGKLWWDFIRLGVVFEKVPYLVGREDELNILLWPVSQISINKNPNLAQTPGYNE